MTTRPYTEDPLVEPPGKPLMAELGWSLEQPRPHRDPLPVGEGAAVDATGPFGRETKGEVVWVSRLSRPFAGLERLNPALPPEAITAGVDKLTRDRSAVSRFSKASSAPSRGLSQGEGWGSGNPLTHDWTHT